MALRRPLRTYLIGLTAVLLCSSCAKPRLSDVTAEVQNTVKIGEPLTTAVSKLGAAGFACGGINPTQCGRQVNSCVEQVLIFNDANFLVTRSKVSGINCMYAP